MSALRARGIVVGREPRAHTEAVLQGAFVLAKAKGGPEVARDCLAHLRRYVQQVFDRPTSREQ